MVFFRSITERGKNFMHISWKLY